jgi:hypothetical protein
MPKKLNKIIQEIFIKKNIDKLQKTEKEIKSLLGETFIKKHTNNIFLERNKVVVEFRTIEAKTELNIIKKNFNTQLKLL